MKQDLRIRALALGLAALVTAVTLGSIDLLAVEQHAATTLARQGTDGVQRVVVVGHRAPQS
jgi:hypothetical protein